MGVDLTEQIILRYNRDKQEPLSLLLISFSYLIRPTEFGPPSFQLTALADLPPEIQQVVLRMLNSFPVNRFLKLSGLHLSPGGELQPITYLTQPVELALDKVLT